MSKKAVWKKGNPGPVLIFLIMVLTIPLSSHGTAKMVSKKALAIGMALKAIVEAGKAPGMIAAIASRDGVIAMACAGIRKMGSDRVISNDDLFHLGSCTKAMTAAMMASLVAAKKLSWDMKLINAIPKLKASIHPDYHPLTLWQLLTHRGGLPKNPTDWYAHGHKEIKTRRLAIVIDNLKRPAAFNNGEHNYSNFGYMIAACMAEQVTGMSWEVLMKKHLFEALGMSSAGFGAPDTAGKNDQPWGHEKNGDGWQPSEDYDAMSLGPAGEVHCTLQDWARFLALFLAPDQSILDRKLIEKLMEPVGFYAGGWGVATQPWAKGLVLSHNGSNGIWYSSVMVAPNLDRAFIVATNSCDFGSTSDICAQVLSQLIRLELNIKGKSKK